ncbi:hypothetical protein AMK21_30610 [Streptomyces sp. CB00316]|nr:hypothetical protein AMK21_30610 [Streptomyces sp. CB00316]
MSSDAPGVQGALEPGGHAAADDLFGSAFLAGTGGGSRLQEKILGFLLRKTTCGDEAAEGVGSAVEGVGESRSFGDLAAGF